MCNLQKLTADRALWRPGQRASTRCNGRRLVVIALVPLLCLPLGLAAASASEPQRSAERDNLTESARLPRNRIGERRLAQARDLVARGAFEAGLSILQDLLNAPDDGFIERGSHAVSLTEEANRLVSQLPPEGRAVYERQFGPAAERALEQARATGQPEALIRVAVRYRHTVSGIAALRELAAGYFDRAAFASAARAYRRLLAHPSIRVEDEAPAVARLILATARGGNLRAARDLLDEHRSWLERTRLTSQKDQPHLGTWLESQLAQPTPDLAASSPNVENDSRQLNGRRQRTTDVFGEMPSMQAAWTYEVGCDGHLASLTESGLAELDLQGIPQVTGFKPLASGNLIIARTLDSLLALDAATGTLQWQRPSGIWPTPSDSHSQLFENSAFREMAADTVVRQMQVDAVLGRISGDGQRVFVIEVTDPDSPASAANHVGNETPISAANERPSHNRLAAYDVQTGDRLWTTGTAEKGAEFGPVYFFGPPAPFEGTLYAVGQQETELFLYAFAPDRGALLWSRLLAAAPRDLAAEPARREMACPIAIADGIAVCPTVAGAIVAIDLSTRMRIWGYRYERESASTGTRRVRGRLDRKPRHAWWQNWRETRLAIESGAVLVASPDSEVLHALDLNRGRPLWTQARESGLFFAGVYQKKALIIAGNEIRAHDVVTGNRVWSAQTGRISAPGYASSSHYFVPLRSGGVAAVALRDGTTERNVPAAKEAPGRLVRWAEGAIAQDHERIQFYPLVKDARSQAEEHVATLPKGDETRGDALYDLILVDREADDFAAAHKRLAELATRSNDTDRAAELKRETLLEELKWHPNRRLHIADAIEPLLTDSEMRIRWQHARARAAAEDGDASEALAAYLELLELNPTGEITVDGPPRRIVRVDRMIQGEMLDQLAEAADSRSMSEADISPAIAKLFAARIESARNSDEPFAWERCLRQLSHLPWGEKLRIELAANTGHGVGFLNAQLELLELAESHNRSRAASAVWELARLMESRSEPFEAAAAYRRLRDEFAKTIVAGENDGRAGEQLVADLPEDSLLAKAVETGPRDPWPEIAPYVTPRDAGRRLPDLHPVPVVTVTDSLFDRLDVFVDREGGEVRFQGAGHRSFWELTLPASRSPFRTAYNLHRGWGWGHLLILQVGTELFAITPLDDNGEPGAKILWHRNTHREPTWDDYELREDRLGFGMGDVVIVDKFRRPIGQVGPVRAGYLCFRDKGTLTAIETVTGEVLWKRFDVSPNAVVGGDDHYVLLSRSDPHEVEVLRAVDGQTLSVVSPSSTPEQRVFDQGRYRIVETSSEAAYRLRRIDLVENRTVWESDFEAKTLPFAVDHERFGLLSPRGTIELISTSTGQTIASQAIEPPAEITQIHTIHDPYRLFVVITDDVDAGAANRLARSRNYYRSPLVNGVLCALDRRTGRLLWQTTLRNEAVPLDQPQSAPLLFTIGFPKNSRRDTATLTCFDKRTGKLLHSTDKYRDGQPLLLDIHPDLGRMELELASETVQFEFRK